MSRAASLAAARLERSAHRDCKRQAQTSSSSYGSWFGQDTSLSDGRAGCCSTSSAAPSDDTLAERVSRMNMESALGMGAYANRHSVVLDAEQSTVPVSSAPAALTELGLPEVHNSSSAAFAWVSKEGALHENHDQGATAILADRTCLFAVLDGHGADGASVSNFSLRCTRARRALASQRRNWLAPAAPFSAVALVHAALR